MPKISVIIPVYNTEKYLRKCLDSVLNQAFEDFEVLLIDDGSTDKSGEICDEYALKDKRIRVFHKENGGVSSARNLGLDNAKGEWITFVDSDDTVNRDYLKDLIDGLISREIGLVIQSFKRIEESKTTVYYIQSGVVFSNDVKELFENKNLNNFGYPVSKLFNRKTIRDYKLTFPTKLTNAEDLSFLLNYIPRIKKINFQEKYNYNYIVRCNSLTTTKKHYKKNWNRYIYNKNDIKNNFGNIIDEFLLSHNKGNLIKTLGIRIFSVFLDLYMSNANKKERIAFLKSLDKQDLKIIKNYSQNLSLFFKISFQILNNKMYFLTDLLLKAGFTYIKNKT